jgi:apoptosis-inducing factor 3
MPNSPPDLSEGIAWDDLPDGAMLRGQLGKDELVLIRRGETVFAIGAQCTHYHANLDEGLLDGEMVRCPLHHARFDIRTGEALAAPALDPVGCWRVERIGTRLFVRERRPQPRRAPPPSSNSAGPILIVGAGAAGLAAAVTLRREGFDGVLKMLSADTDAPYDRPNVSKDFLAGTAPAEWMPLRSDDFYASQNIELLLNAPVTALDLRSRRVTLEGGRALEYRGLLLATGAEPVRLEVPGASPEAIVYVRSFGDGRRIVDRAGSAKRAAVIGSSFIGLEVAASLRARGLEVDVVGLESVPLQRVLGEQVGRFIQDVHESQGVRFHLGCSVQRMDGPRLLLSNGTALNPDLVIAGVGVRPSTRLAEAAGLTVEHGILVDQYLQTSAPGVFAAGDAARWPDRASGERIRVEHWVVAERQGQVAARNMLGRRQPFEEVPFFWSQHYDLTVNYVGHAERWDDVQIDGDLSARSAVVRYRRAGRTLAVATLGRDLDSLRAERALESAAGP